MHCSRLLRRWAVNALAISLAASALAQTTEPRLMASPAIHGDTLVFRYGGDLWVTQVGATSPARRLTSHPGTENRPKISPDGQTVAFLGSYDGANEIYTMPIEGGEPKRLTYESGAAWVIGWTPDGKVAYASNMGNFVQRQMRLRFARAEGGLPIQTQLLEITDGSMFPDGQTIAYMRAWPGNWRRYRGGAHGRISLYNLGTNTYSELPHKNEQNYFPMAVGRSIYYISDKNLATLNLYRYDLDSKKEAQLTRFDDADIKTPNTDGKSVVWERGGYLEVFDIATGKVSRQSPKVLVDLLHTRPRLRKLDEFINSASLSPSGTRMAVEARGEIFTMPVKTGDTRNLTRTSGAREQSPAWSPDGKSIAYISDATGEREVYIQPQEGGAATRLTNTNGSQYITALGWSPDSKHLEIWTLTNDLYILDMATRQLKLVDKLASQGSVSDWSPDGRWLAYTKQGANQQYAVHLYEVETGKLTKATEGFYNDNSVAFDKNGKYLYVRSARTFTPSFGRFEYNLSVSNTERIYLIPLTHDLPNPLRPLSDEDAAPAPARTHVRIDLDGFDRRMIVLPMAAGSPVELRGLMDGVMFVTAVPGASPTLSKFDLKTREVQNLYTGPGASISLTPDGSKLSLLANNVIRVMDVRPGGGDSALKADTSGLQATINPREEWRQIFWDSWRFLRDEFYDPNMRGLDWKAIGKRYEAYLPYVAHRSDLNNVLSMMNNELGTSHAYVSGGDMGPSTPSESIGRLGVDYEVSGSHIRFAKIYYGDTFDESRRGPLGEPGYRVAEGEYLLEVDGEPVTSKMHPDSLLVGKANRYVILTVNASPTLAGARKVRVRPVSSEGSLRYAHWTDATRRYVDKMSGGRIGYMHVPSVLHEGAAEFLRGFYSQTDKEALIVDERWNVGGYFIQQLLVEMLNRKPILGTQFRNSPDGSSIRAIVGPKVMLINEYAGSGGDSFPWTFKAGGAGKLIGRRTLGALVGISNSLVTIDGGEVTAPDMGVYDPKTGYLIAENYGVAPDIEVDMRPDLVAQGKDPQLDTAIKHLLGELAKLPKREPRKEFPKVLPGGRIGGG